MRETLDRRTFSRDDKTSSRPFFRGLISSAAERVGNRGAKIYGAHGIFMFDASGIKQALTSGLDFSGLFFVSVRSEESHC